MTFIAGGVGGSPQPPQIRESETTAFVENMKKNVLGMLPADTFEVNPFTQQNYDAKFKYRDEPSLPMRSPLLFIRSGLDEEKESGSWQPFYDQVLEYFPSEIKERLAWELKQPLENRDPDFAALNQVLIMTAKGLAWLERVKEPIDPDGPIAALIMLNVSLPYVAIQSSLAQAGAIFDSIPQSTNEEFQKLASEAKSATETYAMAFTELKKGNDSPLIQEVLRGTSEKLAELNEQFQAKGFSAYSGQLGAFLSSFSVAAQALTGEGTPSLLIGSSISLTGISSTDSESGLIGNALNTVMDQLVEALLATIPLGPTAEAEELNELAENLLDLGKVAP